MNLAGRAALSVPLIALLAAAFMGLTSMAARPDGSMLEGWSTFRLVFSYTAILALPVGFILAFPMVMLGHLQPEPRGLFVGFIGMGVGLAIGFALGGSFEGVFMFALMGLLCGALWWSCVERFRRAEDCDG